MKNENLIPKFILSEEERLLISNSFTYRSVIANVGSKRVPCFEFKENASTILDDLDALQLCEAKNVSAEDRAFATRAATIAFQSIRELSNVNGANLIEVGKSLKALGRIVALAVVVALANLDIMFARRLLPMVRAI